MNDCIVKAGIMLQANKEARTRETARIRMQRKRERGKEEMLFIESSSQLWPNTSHNSHLCQKVVDRDV